MKKGWKRALAFVLTLAMGMTLIPYMQGGVQEVQAANEVNVSTAEDLISNAASTDNTIINLTNDIVVSHTIEHSGGDLTLALHGHTISGAGQSMTSVLNVAGGTVTITADSGTPGKIVAPTGAACVRVEKDANVNAMGGSYSAQNGSPAIAIYKDKGNYTDFDYHFSKTSNYVLTDYSFAVINNYTCSASNVSVVQGGRIKFNTERSRMEAYHYDDTEEPEAKAEDFADNYSCPPLSIATNGNNMHVMQEYLPEPVADQSRLPGGVDSLTFAGWRGGQGMVESMADVLPEYQASLQYPWGITFDGVWIASVSTGAGFHAAFKAACVRKIKLNADLTLDSTCLRESDVEIDLNGHTITYAGSNKLFDMYAGFKIYDAVGTGGINCNGGSSCILARKDLTIDGGTYRTIGPVAIKIEPLSDGNTINLTAGTFWSTAADGHGITVSRKVAYQFHTGLLSNSIPKISDDQLYTCFAKKLVISRDTEPTHVIDVNDVTFQNITYGAQIQNIQKISIKNKGNSDIVVNRIEIADEGSNGLPSKCFSLDGVQAGQIQPGIEVLTGDTDNSVGIKVGANVPAGTYKGIITVYYQSLCNQGETYSKTAKVSITVNKRKLTIGNPSITLEKIYDATKTAKVIAGNLFNLVGTDSVSASASAAYDTADTGSKKIITVHYSIRGRDSENYIAPDNAIYGNGKITKAAGEASIRVADCYVGEKIQIQPISKTNGIQHIIYYYKGKGTNDSHYTTAMPTDAGKYTVKAVFASTKNYAQVSATADFSITQIATPAVPYTISGQSGSNGWYLGSVTVHPPVGYTISTSKNSGFAANLVIDSSASPDIYLKTQTGAVTAQIAVGAIRIDTSAPSVSGQGEGITIGTQVWNSLSDLLDFQLFYKDKQQIVIHASDTESQIASYQYLVSATQMTLSELQQSTAWESGQSFPIAPQSAQRSIIYAKITNGAGLVSYVSSNGLVFDAQAPVIKGATDGQTYYGDHLTVTISDDYLNNVTINGTTQHMTDKENSFILAADDSHSYQIVATDKSGNSTAITVSVKETWIRDGISSEGTKTLASGVAYKFGGGKWSVQGDTTVYEGNTTFYATTSGDYEFKQQ